MSRESAAERHVTAAFYLPPERWAQVQRDFGGSDNLLARRVELRALRALPPYLRSH